MPCDQNSDVWLFIEDGPPNAWWASPAIRVVGGSIITGQTFEVEADVENKGAQSASGVEVYFYLCQGGTTIGGGAFDVQFTNLDQAGGVNAKRTVTSAPFVAPQTGHYCLIVELRHPDDCNTPRPDGASFDPPGYEQIAQRNVEILDPPPPPSPPNPGGSGGGGDNRFALPIDLLPFPQRNREVRVRVVVEKKPSPELLRALGLGEGVRVAERPGVALALFNGPTDHLRKLPKGTRPPRPEDGVVFAVQRNVPARVYLDVRSVRDEPDGVTIVHVIEERVGAKKRDLPLGGRTFVFATGKHRGLAERLVVKRKGGKPKGKRG